ncbi:hypothetical protein [Tepidibacter hydrothermalis]|uniref:Arsenical resistance operon trans-acting repressor ArsD n=1 Tax=Tepidibacter hydrothermalis TaxID=3036126 RepID=A0ABY8EG06_9FIRM|nr:hypothetical protein [Tepidibacter hydrothermalis]WFD11886.1 hypothetical protein P4S50_07365 [Tepidibacter hydrothermalis]
MKNKINIHIYGSLDWVSGGSSSSCGGCPLGKGGGGGCCGAKASKSMVEVYEDFIKFIEKSDVNESINYEFYDISKINVLDHENIIYVYEEGYELPYCVIDGMVRYYGGVSKELIYRDVKELLD